MTKRRYEYVRKGGPQVEEVEGTDHQEDRYGKIKVYNSNELVLILDNPEYFTFSEDPEDGFIEH